MIKNSREVKEIHRLLKKTIVPPDTLSKFYNGDQEELRTILAPLQQYSLHHTPDKLFRMRTVSDRALDALENDAVFLTRADFFNDPYDCFLTFDAQKMKSAIMWNLSDKRMERTLAKRNVHFPMGELFKTKEDFFDYFQSRRSEYIEKCTNILPNVTVELRKNTFVTSLTENILSPVMWAHYANNHTGFAIEYQFRKDMFLPQPMVFDEEKYNWYGWRSILPVLYSDMREDGTALAEWFALCEWTNYLVEKEIKELDMSQSLADLLLKTKLSLQKSAEWAYEHEWRIIISNNWPNSIDETDCHLIYPASGIYLGDRISKANKDRLIDIAKKKNIPIYQMYVDQAEKEYKMEFTMLTAD